MSSNSIYTNKGVIAPKFEKGHKLSSLLSKFQQEPLPKDSLESALQRRKSFTSDTNKAKRKSLTLSNWNEGVSVEAIFGQTELEVPEISAPIPVVSSFTSAQKLVPSDVGTCLEDRKRAFLSPHRPDSAQKAETDDDRKIVPNQVKQLIENFSQHLEQGNSQSLQRTKSRSRRSKRISRTFSDSPRAERNRVSDTVENDTKNTPKLSFIGAHKSTECLSTSYEKIEIPSDIISGDTSTFTSTTNSLNDSNENTKNVQEDDSSIKLEGNLEENKTLKVDDSNSSCEYKLLKKEEQEAFKITTESEEQVEQQNEAKQEKQETTAAEVEPEVVTAEKNVKTKEEVIPDTKEQEEMQSEPLSPINSSAPKLEAPKPNIIKTDIETSNDEDGPPSLPPVSPMAKFDENEGIPSEDTSDDDPNPLEEYLTLDSYMELIKGDSPMPLVMELMNQGIDDDDIIALFDALEESGKINNLQKLLLNGNDFEVVGAARLASLIAKNYNIEVIDIAWNMIGAEGAKLIAEGLVTNTKLQVLIIDGNDLGMEGAVSMAEHLSLNSGLVQLELKDNSISDSGAACLAYSLRKHKTLQTLDFTCNSITADCIEQIGKYLIGDPEECATNDSEYNLQTLVLNSNIIGNEGAYFLADSLAIATTLQSLQLRGCGIQTDGILGLAEALMEAEELKITELDLNANANTVESELALNDLLMSHKNLYVEWKDPQIESSWDTEDIHAIINHYGFGQILGNILHGHSLSPLIENHTLLGFIDIDDISVAEKFVAEAFSDELILSGLETITSMIRRGLPASEADDFDDYEGEDLYLDENDEDLEDLTPLVQTLYQWMPKLVEKLQEESDPVPTSAGMQPFFGKKRLMILGLIIALMDEEGSVVLNEQLIELKMPTIAFNLLLKYPRHSILHKQIQLYLRVSLRTDTLRKELFEESKILDFIETACREEWAKPISERESFSGYLALFIADILSFEFDDQVCDYLDSHPTFNTMLDTVFVKYKKELQSEFQHPKYCN